MIPLELDINDVSISGGDFSVGDIGFALEPFLEQIAREMSHYCEGRKTVVFLPLISTAQKFCEILKNYGMNAVEVNGNSNDRTEILQDFEDGKYDVLCNSMLLTEGWDCPSWTVLLYFALQKCEVFISRWLGVECDFIPVRKICFYWIFCGLLQDTICADLLHL